MHYFHINYVLIFEHLGKRDACIWHFGIFVCIQWLSGDDAVFVHHHEFTATAHAGIHQGFQNSTL